MALTYKATWQGVVLAQSSDVVEVEGNIYFPREALDESLVTGSEYHTVCPWKGTASYLSVVVGERVNKDAVWFYPQPKAGAEMVANRVAFWKGVQVEQVAS